MSKEVQNSRLYKRDLKYTVYLLLKDGMMPKEICSKLNMKMSALSYHLRLLKESGSIRKIGYGVWETLKYKKKEVQKVMVGGMRTYDLKLSNDNRGHAFKFKIKVPKLFNWDKRRDFMDKRGIDYTIINRGFSERIIFKGCKVWLSKSSIVVYFPKGLSFFGKTARDSEDRAVFEMISIMKGLDNLFRTSFKIRKAYQIKVFGKHHANIRNGLARMYNDDNRRVAVANGDGQWLLIDDSFNFDELETVGNKGRNDATRDMDDVVKPFFNSLKDKPFTAYDFEKLGVLLQQLGMRQIDSSANLERIEKILENIAKKM